MAGLPCPSWAGGMGRVAMCDEQDRADEQADMADDAVSDINNVIDLFSVPHAGPLTRTTILSLRLLGLPNSL
jgi:hypothetical protein